MGALGRLKHAFNTFLNQEDDMLRMGWDLGASYGSRPDRVRMFVTNERSIISAIYMRIALDVAAVDIRHVRLDEKLRNIGVIDSGLQNCLNLEANIDQTGRAFLQDAIMTMFDKGSVALVPVDTSIAPAGNGSYDIETMRVGTIVQWYPRHIRVELYNDRTGRREQVTLEKRNVAIIENPLYTVMNEPNSTLQRLIRKLNMLDAVDEQSASGKLDLIIQLPYTIKSEARRQQADQRRRDLEVQLKDSKYGIGYTDGTEKITQLNRPAENNLLKQVEYLTEMLYGQLGITAEVMNGTADEKTMINYINRTIEPILAAMADELKRKFLSKTARSQRQSIEYYRDPFKLVPMSELAELADKFTRNEIVSANEFRGFIGMVPSDDPKADKLINSNMPQPPEITAGEGDVVEGEIVEDDPEMDMFDEMDDIVNAAFKELGVDPDG